MNTIPHKSKRRSIKQKRGSNATKIVQMFHGVHAKSSKRFNIRVTVMQRVNVLVHSFDMNKPMGKIKMEFAIQWDPEKGQNEHSGIPRVGKGLSIAHKGYFLGGTTVHINRLPNGILHNAQKGVPNVMGNLAKPIGSIGIKRPLAPI